MEDVWEIFCEELNRVHEEHELQIHSFVLMTNHFHLIASTPGANVSQCMQRFMHRTSRRLTRAGNRINETFAGRHHKSVLGSYWYYLNAYKYVYQNPVRAGLVERAELYPYSTLFHLVSEEPMMLKLLEDPMLKGDTRGTLAWINKKPAADKVTAMRSGLRKAHFTPGEDRNCAPLILANELI
jgi:REP element-mobilizing transposase RayT